MNAVDRVAEFAFLLFAALFFTMLGWGIVDLLAQIGRPGKRRKGKKR